MHYGIASRSYTNTTDVGKVTNCTVPGLVTNVTYYFVVTAYNALGLESDPSNEVSNRVSSGNSEANHPPALGCLSPQISVDEGTSLAFQLCATDPDLPRQTLTWQVGPGLLSGPAINPNTGLLTWTPREDQGPSTNLVNVVVRDNGSPSLSDTRTVAIIVNEVNRPPVLAAIADRSASVLNTLFVTNVASDPDVPTNHLQFSLDPGAPAGARVHRSTGVFWWTPARTQAPSTNTVTVRVTDDGVPARPDTKTFTVVVADYLEVMVGSTALLAGQFGSVPVVVSATAPVTNVNFTVVAPVPGLTDFVLTSPVPTLAMATLQPSEGLYSGVPAEYYLNLQTASGQALVGTQTVLQLNFRAVTNAPSAFVPLRVSGVSAIRLNGLPLVRTLAQDGRVAFINQAPLLEASMNGAQRQLVLYASPRPSYTVQYAPRLRPPVVWTPIWNGALSNLVQVLTVPAISGNIFYRATAP